MSKESNQLAKMSRRLTHRKRRYDEIEGYNTEGNSLTTCSICSQEMENPKALPCLHSFCLKCLESSSSCSTSFVCPLCQEKIPLPPDGVNGFRDSFFINRMKERKAIFKVGKVIMPCASCEATGRQVTSRCMNCNGFLCYKCVRLHKTIKPLRIHKVFTLDQLRLGKVDMSKLMLEKDECCPKHKEQVLRWYCKTCDIPICRDCTVMEHTRPEHDYVPLESAVKDHLEEIKNLVTACKDINRKLIGAITKADKVKAKLDSQLTKATKQLKDAESQAKEEFLKALQENVKTTTDQLNAIKMKRYEKIENEMMELRNMQSKISNVQEIGNQLIKSGSKHDVASNYAVLCKTLKQVQGEITLHNPVNVSLSKVKFNPHQKDSVESVHLGTLSSGSMSPRDRTGKWVLEKEIGVEGPGKIKGGFGVAVDPTTSDILIADWTDQNVKVFDSDGNYKLVIFDDYLDLHPHDVAVSVDGFLFITDYTACVKVFSHDGIYLNQFPARSPDGKSSITDGSELYGLAIDSDGNLLVGSSKKYISKHKQDGTHIATMKTAICPLFIGMTRANRCAYSDTRIIQYKGSLLYATNMTASYHWRSWRPCGVCCSDDGIIYVSCYGSSYGGGQGGIYSFTEDGSYLGCITTDVTWAQGIALIDNDRLVVVQFAGRPAKIFSYVE